MELAEMKQAVIAALEDVKARDIVVLDVRKLTPLWDIMIVASADSARQTKALANNVQEKLGQMGVTACGVEGEENGEWILVDLGDVVVHVMQPAVREYYDLESLWGGSRVRLPLVAKG